MEKCTVYFGGNLPPTLAIHNCENAFFARSAYICESALPLLLALSNKVPENSPDVDGRKFFEIELSTIDVEKLIEV